MDVHRTLKGLFLEPKRELNSAPYLKRDAFTVHGELPRLQTPAIPGRGGRLTALTMIDGF